MNTILLVYKTKQLVLSSETFLVFSQIILVFYQINTLCEQNVELYILQLVIYKINIRP